MARRRRGRSTRARRPSAPPWRPDGGTGSPRSPQAACSMSARWRRISAVTPYLLGPGPCPAGMPARTACHHAAARAARRAVIHLRRSSRPPYPERPPSGRWQSGDQTPARPCPYPDFCFTLGWHNRGYGDGVALADSCTGQAARPEGTPDGTCQARVGAGQRHGNAVVTGARWALPAAAAACARSRWPPSWPTAPAPARPDAGLVRPQRLQPRRPDRPEPRRAGSTRGSCIPESNSPTRRSPR